MSDYEETRALTLSIHHDEGGITESPREDAGNLGVMVCFHKCYKLGDETNLKSSMFEDWDALETYLIDEEDAVITIPISMVDHGGISISCGVSRGWDSGQIGFIYTTRKAIFGDYVRQRRLTKKLRERVLERLKEEVTMYNQYLTGDIWGYVIEDEDGEHVDSCWGYYGQDIAREDGEEALRFMQTPSYESQMAEKNVVWTHPNTHEKR